MTATIMVTIRANLAIPQDASSRRELDSGISWYRITYSPMVHDAEYSCRTFRNICQFQEWLRQIAQYVPFLSYKSCRECLLHFALQAGY